MNKEEIINILKDWNFWEKKQETGITRELYLKRMKDYIFNEQIIIITGPRRAGKSYLMRQLIKNLIDNGINPNETLYINFEDPRFTIKSPVLLEKIFETYMEKLMPKNKPYLFLDEIQEINGFEKWLLMMKELSKAKIFISGSNAKLLSREFGTLLTGRHLDITIFPLSFKEFLIFNGQTGMINTLEDLRYAKGLLMKYFEYGSFPEVVISAPKKEILLEYYEDIVTKDILRRYNIRKENELNAVLKYFFSNISTLFTYKAIERAFDISITAVKKYSICFEQVYLLFFISRFSYKVKEQEKSPRKIYSIDTGLCNTIGFKFSDNYGRLAENLVAISLKRKQLLNKNLELYYWKDDVHREVDFVLKEKEKITQLIQVCWNISNEKTIKRETKGLAQAMNELKCKNAIIITEEESKEIEINNSKVQIIPLWKWLLEN